jgi:VIT1/CCC1 family predicted Fe2+/Mn2+ transporter
MARIIEAYRRHGRYISPSVENAARVIFALVGGIFLLAPIILMTYIESRRYMLLTTCLFVLFVATTLALASKASNQELLGATTAYAAVLVVFVGNTIGLAET